MKNSEISDPVTQSEMTQSRSDPAAGKPDRYALSLRAVRSDHPVKGRVLVVDDVRNQADSFAYILREHGYAAIPVYSGKDAVAHAWAIRPDLAVVNLTMPEMDGIQTAVEIWDRLPNVKILFTSAYERDILLARTRLTAARLGRDYEVIQKPVDLDAFLGSIA